MSEALAKALVAAQAEMPKVKATGSNPHFGSSYVTLDDLLDKCLPVLNRHGLSLHQFPIGVGEAGLPSLVTIVSHESGEVMQYTMPLLVAKQDMQALGSAITYARRYALASALGVAEGDDDDGHRAVEAQRLQEPYGLGPHAQEPTWGSEGHQPPETWTASPQQARLIRVVDDLIGAGQITEEQVQAAAQTTEQWPRLVRALDDGAAAGLADRLETFKRNLDEEASNPVPDGTAA